MLNSIPATLSSRPHWRRVVATLKAKGAALRTTDGMAFDTSTAMGKCFLDMLGTFAEFETNLRRERQLEGIAKAKAAGVYQGRKPTIDAGAVRKLAPRAARRSRRWRRVTLPSITVRPR